MLPTNVAQALIIMAAIFAGFTMPITAPQILWVNMVTSVALGLVISFEPHEMDVMTRPPRAVDRPIVDGFGLWRIIFVGLALLTLTLSFFFWMKSRNASDNLARTVAVNALVIGQVFYLLNSRFKLDSSMSLKAHFGNPYLPMGIGAVVVLQLLFTYVPPLQVLFDTEAIPLGIWPSMLLGGFLFFLLVEGEKLILRTVRSAHVARMTALNKDWPSDSYHRASIFFADRRWPDADCGESFSRLCAKQSQISSRIRHASRLQSRAPETAPGNRATPCPFGLNRIPPHCHRLSMHPTATRIRMEAVARLGAAAVGNRPVRSVGRRA